jgi:hypothetical protein
VLSNAARRRSDSGMKPAEERGAGSDGLAALQAATFVNLEA